MWYHPFTPAGLLHGLYPKKKYHEKDSTEAGGRAGEREHGQWEGQSKTEDLSGP
uniref:Uncharacterized protein n=1 Tax=Anguilla anguilla TaxID=7936 RepID=A0A0E9SPF8_ANGAN